MSLAAVLCVTLKTIAINTYQYGITEREMTLFTLMASVNS